MTKSPTVVSVMLVTFQKHDNYSHVENILEVYNVLVKFGFATSETKLDI